MWLSLGTKTEWLREGLGVLFFWGGGGNKAAMNIVKYWDPTTSFMGPLSFIMSELLIRDTWTLDIDIKITS